MRLFITCLLGIACSSDASPPATPPAVATPTRALHVPLHDARGTLDVLLDVTSPTVTLTRDGRSAIGRDPILELVSRSPQLAAEERLEYRLRFAIDRCVFEAAETAGWPGTCGYPHGGTPPHAWVPFELLIHRDSTYLPGTITTEVHRVAASCVPSSGAGPTCFLSAIVARSNDAPDRIVDGTWPRGFEL